MKSNIFKSKILLIIIITIILSTLFISLKTIIDRPKDKEVLSIFIPSLNVDTSFFENLDIGVIKDVKIYTISETDDIFETYLQTVGFINCDMLILSNEILNRGNVGNTLYEISNINGLEYFDVVDVHYGILVNQLFKEKINFSTDTNYYLVFNKSKNNNKDYSLLESIFKEYKKALE